MILQSLVALYERLAGSDDPTQRLPEPGWKENEIAFVIDINDDGRPMNVVPLLQPQQRGRARAPLRRVPQEAKRTGKIPDAANEENCWQASLFWDSVQWALGVPKTGDEKARKEAEVRHGQFRLRHHKFAHEAGGGVASDPGMQAILRFLDGDAAIVIDQEQLARIREAGGNIAFRYHGDDDLICHRPAIRAAISVAALGGDEGVNGQCLVSGRMARIKRLHPSIQGVSGAQSSGANIVSFNAPAFESYGLSQGENAPISEYAAFAYTTALNFLLRHGSPFRARAGSTTVVFWAGRQTPNETLVCSLMAGVAEDDPWQNAELVARLYTAPATGVPPPLDDPSSFYVLGLSAESRSRLTVRFFHSGTVADVARTILRWFEEIRIAPEGDRPLSMVSLRRAVAVQGDLKNAPPLLESELLRAAYTGSPLPQNVLAQVLVRCAAESVTRERAALIKAFLVRNLGEKISVTLDTDEAHPAYRLGRLFALLEDIQRVAVRPKRTIRDSYWGAAASTPSTVFPQLLDLANSHLGKIKQDRQALARWFENQIGEILDMRKFPRSLSAHHSFEEQGRFAIGYWQQRYRSKPDDVAADEAALLHETGEAA